MFLYKHIFGGQGFEGEELPAEGEGSQSLNLILRERFHRGSFNETHLGGIKLDANVVGNFAGFISFIY